MKKYLDLCREILDNGTFRKDRTGTGTISIFGAQIIYDISEEFPLLTTKKVFLRGIIEELLWFIKGDTNIKYLVQNNVNIWNEWVYKAFVESKDFNGETQEEFIKRILNDDDFAKVHGDLGPVYGKQWRNFNGVDQLSELIENIKHNPFSRRLIICAWNPADIKYMKLPPCHSFLQFYVNDGKLDCHLYQRSADLFLGVPFNIASYSLFTMMIAQVCGLKAGRFIHTFGDVHIYRDHIEQVNEQLKREPLKLPVMKINPNVKSIFDFKIGDFELQHYNSHPPIKAKVSV